MVIVKDNKCTLNIFFNLVIYTNYGYSRCYITSNLQMDNVPVADSGRNINNQQDFTAWIVHATAVEVVNVITSIFFFFFIVSTGTGNLTERLTALGGGGRRACHQQRRVFSTHSSLYFRAKHDIGIANQTKMDIPFDWKHKHAFQ